MSFSTLLFLAHIVARALALLGGRVFARVATKGSFENAHLECFLRRLHAKGVIGAEGQSFLDTMKCLVMAVTRVARFDGVCPVEREPTPLPRRAWALARARNFTAPIPAHDSS